MPRRRGISPRIPLKREPASKSCALSAAIAFGPDTRGVAEAEVVEARPSQLKRWRSFPGRGRGCEVCAEASEGWHEHAGGDAGGECGVLDVIDGGDHRRDALAVLRDCAVADPVGDLPSLRDAVLDLGREGLGRPARSKCRWMRQSSSVTVVRGPVRTMSFQAGMFMVGCLGRSTLTATDARARRGAFAVPS